VADEPVTFWVSFDIDGTMEFGDPPGPITVDFVRGVAALGHVVGSASDRTRGNQTAAWEHYGIDVAFVGGKHHLHEVRERIVADRYLHIGDTSVDGYYARLAGFEFLFVEELIRGAIDPAVVLGHRPDASAVEGGGSTS
jgi:hypothetical protein